FPHFLSVDSSLLRLFTQRPKRTLFPYTTLFRSQLGRGDACLPGRGRGAAGGGGGAAHPRVRVQCHGELGRHGMGGRPHGRGLPRDRKSTRLNSSHVKISYAVFCLKKKKSNE